MWSRVGGCTGPRSHSHTLVAYVSVCLVVIYGTCLCVCLLLCRAKRWLNIACSSFTSLLAGACCWLPRQDQGALLPLLLLLRLLLPLLPGGESEVLCPTDHSVLTPSFTPSPLSPPSFTPHSLTPLHPQLTHDAFLYNSSLMSWLLQAWRAWPSCTPWTSRAS